MIFGNIEHSSQYRGLSKNLDSALEYMASHDFRTMVPGKYSICGDDVFVKISDILTKPEKDAAYEAHDRFLDIQMVVRGYEKICYSFRKEMPEMLNSIPEKDVSYFAGNGQPILLSDGDFLILFPDDVHAPALCITQPQLIRKALFKVRIS